MSAEEAEKSLDFIRSRVKEDKTNAKNNGESIPGFLPNLMATYTWGMPKVFVLILE